MNTQTGYNNNGASANGGNNGKFKPYRNRPGKRQGLLELFSFLLLIASAPAYLGGAFSIFIAIATFVLGIIGLFAWTRRHARLFVLLAAAVIAACIVNIILRGTFHAQCVPFYNYRNNFNLAGAGAAGTTTTTTTTNQTSIVNGTVVSQLINSTVTNSTGNNSTSGAGAFVGGASVNGNHNDYDHSIWCGNNYIVYIVNAIIIALAIPALLFALASLKKRNGTPAAARTTETSTTQTRTTEAY